MPCIGVGFGIGIGLGAQLILIFIFLAPKNLRGNFYGCGERPNHQKKFVGYKRPKDDIGKPYLE